MTIEFDKLKASTKAADINNNDAQRQFDKLMETIYDFLKYLKV